MRKTTVFGSLIVVAALLATACTQAAPPAAPAAPPAATTPAQPAPSPPVAGPSPSAVAAERVDGVVQSFANGQLTLTTGRSFAVPTAARVQRALAIAPSDLKQGDYVAITGKRQPDNTLLASMVNVFPPSLGEVAPGQRPLPEGNLMTNATIDQIQGTSFTVTFPGGGARVQLAPEAQITRLVDASAADVHPGDTVTAQVVDGAARVVSITSGASPQAGASPAPSSAGSATVQIRDDARLGSLLTDSQGRTVYRFDRDTSGASTCTGGCAQTWPPLLQAAGRRTGSPDLAGKLAVVDRADGGRQVTYNGIPLYTYSADTQPGDTKGDGVGGNWHVVRPADTAP